MGAHNQNRVTIAAVGLLVCVLTGASIVILPVRWAGVVNFFLAFTATCGTIWLGWRRGVTLEEMMSYGGGSMLSVMIGSAMATMFLFRNRVPFTDGETDAWSTLPLAAVSAPMLALFVPMAIAQFNQSYPGRLQRWLKPSEEATRSYLRQLVKEAEHAESLAKYRWEASRQSREHLEERLAEFEVRFRGSHAYR